MLGILEYTLKLPKLKTFGEKGARNFIWLSKSNFRMLIERISLGCQCIMQKYSRYIVTKQTLAWWIFPHVQVYYCLPCACAIWSLQLSFYILCYLLLV